MIKFNHVRGDTECYESNSCSYSSVESSGSDAILCYGHRSCEHALEIVTYGNGDIFCHGSYSCYGAASLESRTLNQNWMYCWGLFSCSNVGLIIANRGPIWCYAEQSCTNSTLIIPNWNIYDILCHGDTSCANSQLTTTDSFFFQGYLSGINATMYTNDTEATFLFRGAASGYNATIFCRDGSTCNVECYGNGCKKLNLKCSNSSGIYDYINENANGCTYNIDCLGAEFDEYICVNGYQYPDSDENDVEQIPLFLNVSRSTLKNSYNIGNVTGKQTEYIYLGTRECHLL